MELQFGTHVREHGYRIGRLAGVEVERGTQQVRRIVFSGDGEPGSHAESRPLECVPVDHFAGDIVLHPVPANADQPMMEPLILNSSTKVARGGHQMARLTGVELSPGSGELAGVFGRQHWWSRQFRLDRAGLDFSIRGEVRAGSSGTRAA